MNDQELVTKIITWEIEHLDEADFGEDRIPVNTQVAAIVLGLA